MKVDFLSNVQVTDSPWTGWNMYGIAQEAATADGKSPSLIRRKLPDSVSYTPTAVKIEDRSA